MTRKHYRAIANAIRTERALIEAENLNGEKIEEQWEITARVAQRLATILAEDNPRFNRDTFLEACGIAE